MGTVLYVITVMVAPTGFIWNHGLWRMGAEGGLCREHLILCYNSPDWEARNTNSVLSTGIDLLHDHSKVISLLPSLSHLNFNSESRDHFLLCTVRAKHRWVLIFS